MRGKHTMKGNRRPLKKLIALWVVFAMLVVPFASHVGQKEGAKAESGAGTVAIEEDAKQAIADTIELNVVEMNDVLSTFSTTKNVVLSKAVQTYSFDVSILTYDSTLYTSGLLLKYKEFSSDDTVPTNTTSSDTGLEDIPDTGVSVSDSKKYGIYVCIDDGASIDYALQYIVNVTYKDSAFTSEDGIYCGIVKQGDGAYVGTSTMKAGASAAFRDATVMYYVKEGTAATDEEKKTVSNYTLSTALSTDAYAGKEVYAYAALVSSEATPRVLEYKELGNVNISADRKGPTISAPNEVKIWDTTANAGLGDFINDSAFSSHQDENGVYYGNSEKYNYTMTIEDEGVDDADLDISGVDPASITVKLIKMDGSGDTVTLTKAADIGNILDGQFAYSANTLRMILTDEQVTGGAYINITAKDNMGNETIFSSINGTSPFAIKQVEEGTAVVGVAFADGTSWDVSQPITFGKLIAQKQLVVTIKSTDVVTKVTLKDDWEGTQMLPVESEGVDRTYETKWTFTVPKGTVVTSETLSGLSVNAYKAGDVDSLITTSYNLGDIIYDAEAPTITEIKLQKRQNSSYAWSDVDTSTLPIVTEIDTLNGVDFEYQYKITVTDAGGSGLDKVYVGAEEATLESANVYTYEIPVDTWNADHLYNQTVFASDVAGNACEVQDLPSLKKLNTEIKYEFVYITDEDDVSVGNQNLSIKTNKKHTLSVKVSSSYPIKTIRLVGADGYEQVKEYATSAESGSPDASNRYTVTYSFELPEDTDNAKLYGMYLEVTDYRPGSISSPARYPKNTTKFIGDILYDRTKPVFTLQSALDSGKWYKEYNLGYAIASGNGSQSVESNLASAAYTLQNGVDTTGALTSLTPNGTTVAGTIAIPQSTGINGTLISFTAQDECENSLPPTSYRIKVDGQKPKIDLFDVNGKMILADAIEGDVTIRANVSDNLTIASATIRIVGPDGIDVTKSLCDTGERVNISNANSFTLNDFLGKQAPDGNYTATVNVSDKAGNAAATQSISFIVDNTIPVVTAKIVAGTTAGKQPGMNFDGTACDYYYSSNVSVLLTYEDDNMEASAVTVTDNGNKLNLTWQRIEGTNKYQTTYVATQEGAHTINISAEDNAGNVAVTKQVVFVRDTVAPTIAAVLNGGMVYSESMGTVDLTSAAKLNLSVSDANEDVLDFHYQLVKTAPDALPVTADYITTDNRTFNYTDEADYTVNVYSIDKAGNRGPARTVQFRVDTAAPELKISGASSGSSLNSGTTLTFTMIESFWKDASGTVTITRKAGDGASETTYKTIDFKPTARTTNVTESLTETGEYKVTFTAKDRVGHTSEAATYTVKIDKDKPVITLSGVANNDKTTGEVEFSAQIEDDFYLTKSISIKATRTYLDASTNQEKTEDIKFTGYNAAASATIIRDTFQEDGLYKIQITCKDAAGNEDVQEVSFTIDKSKPVLDSKVLGAYEGTLTAFAWDYDINDLVYDLTVCDVHMYLNGVEYDGTSEIEDGVYEMKITAEDELGNYEEQIVNFTLDTKAPTFIVTGVEDGEIKNEQYTIAVSLQLDEDVLDSVALNGTAVDVSDNKASLTVSEKGEYELTMKAHDAAGNEAEKTIHFTYGEKSQWWIFLIIGIAAVLVIGGIVFVVVRKKSDKNDR